MLTMIRTIVVLICLLSCVILQASDEKRSSPPSYDYEIARTHEIRPHRQNIPVEGIEPGSNLLCFRLTVSATGDVTNAVPHGEDKLLKFWPELQPEVYQWKFTPFEKDGKPVIAVVGECVTLEPSERLPKNHVAPPVLRPDSNVVITLERIGCFGSCPSYTVVVSTDGIEFTGNSSVVAVGKHTEKTDPNEVRELAKKFIAADFYSMDSSYRAWVTDHPTYLLSIAIDGHEKNVEDYVGSWQGMPAIITELEDDVDQFAHTQRWISGSEGLVPLLRAEKFNFQTYEAQTMLKQAAGRGKTETVRDFLEAGVPLKPLTAPKPKEPYNPIPLEHVGWLTAASANPEILQILIRASASKDDQNDKDLALRNAAQSGKVEAAKALIGYGADPNTDLSKLIVTEDSGGMSIQVHGDGSVLISAAQSGNPEIIREILRYHPYLELRDRTGWTAIFRAGFQLPTDDEKVDRVECIRLLGQAGANVNARDSLGNTPLHDTVSLDVQEELLKLGADVNAQNNSGQTPLFTVGNYDAIPLFIKHGADPTLQNKKGETAVEAAKTQDPHRQEVLQKAIQEANQN